MMMTTTICDGSSPPVQRYYDDEISHHLLNEFRTLLRRSDALLRRDRHRRRYCRLVGEIDRVDDDDDGDDDENDDEFDVVVASETSMVHPGATPAAANGGRFDVPATAAPDVDDNDDDDDDDDAMGMMMLGGGLYSESESEEDDGGGADGNLVSSVIAATRVDASNARRPPSRRDDGEEEEEEDNDDDEEEDDDFADEDDAAFLRRASSVHDALLLTICTPTCIFDGRELARSLVDAMSRTTSISSSIHMADLARLLSSHAYIDPAPSISSSSSSLRRRKRMRMSRSLLVMQFLLRLDGIRRRESRGSVGRNDDDCDVTASIVLPVIFGGGDGHGSIYLAYDVLRDAALDLRPPIASEEIARASSNACLDALRRVVSVDGNDDDDANRERRRVIEAACKIMARIHDDVRDRDVMATGAARHAMHRAVAALLRGIVVCRDREADDDADDDVGSGEARRPRPTLSLGALRPISGILLPKLYPPGDDDDDRRRSTRVKSRSDVDAMESLWIEISTLLREYDRILYRTERGEGGGEGGKSRDDDDRNYDAAPMAATQMLCVVLPKLRGMDLPPDVIFAPATTPPSCRPIYQRRVWNLIRHCMGRCGGSRGGRDGAIADATGGGRGGRGTSLLSRPSSGGNNATNADEFAGGDWEADECTRDRASMDQLLRRRSAHALRIMLEHERTLMLRNGSSRDGSKSRKNKKTVNGEMKHQGNGEDESIRRREDIELWMKYVLCFEMLEMETELHLVEQVWTTVAEITSSIVDFRRPENGDDDMNKSLVLRRLPRMTWDDIGSLLRLVLLSEAPTMRKLGLYRFLCGHAGVDVPPPKTVAIPAANIIGSDITGDDDNCTTFMNRPKEKTGNTKKTPSGEGGKSPTNDAPLSTVNLDFIIDVVLRSYDSIVGTKVGDNMQVEEGGKQERVSIADLLSKFLTNYTQSLATEDASIGAGATRLSEFVNMIFGPGLIQCSKARSLMLYYRSVAYAIDTMAPGCLNIEPNTIHATIRSLRGIFSSGGAPKLMQEELRSDLALVLKSSIPWNKVDPCLILQVLGMFPPPDELLMINDATQKPLSKARDALGKWLVGIDDGGWAKNASSSCASAFVSGQLMPFGDKDILSGVNLAEREIGMSVCVFCLLSGGGSELLWPAIFKGLATAVTASSSSIYISKANRSMLLLEYGCKEGILSGMGNGDILLSKTNRFMLPPPPNIDSLLCNAAQFIMSQLVSMSMTLFETDAVNATSGGSTRSSTSNSSSTYIAILVGQLRVLHLAYPSSISLSQAVNNMFEDCVNSLSATKEARIDPSASQNCVKSLTLCYAALSCGASFGGDEMLDRLVSTCRMILDVELSIPTRIKNDAKQACRSIFQYAKW
jgi:hypothetical protein